jgi:hypothetical protein
MFNGRLLLIASKHEKTKVLAPLLERALSVKCISLTKFDTDTLGTFSGEVERANDPLITLRKKCRMAAESHRIDLVIATEGSFGPHPIYASLPANDELVMLLDLKNDLEVTSRELSTQTNYAGAAFSTFKDLLLFAIDKGFPQHGFILKDKAEHFTICAKGICREDDLQKAFNQIIASHGSVWAETDMRAHLNPTRMSVIEKAAQKLISNLQSECPNCRRPGFITKKYVAGLPCSDCGCPTPSIKSELKICEGCGYELMNYPKNKLTADPMHCQVCNP